MTWLIALSALVVGAVVGFRIGKAWSDGAEVARLLRIGAANLPPQAATFMDANFCGASWYQAGDPLDAVHAGQAALRVLVASASAKESDHA